MRDELRLVLSFTVTRRARWLIRTGRRYQLQTGHQLRIGNRCIVFIQQVKFVCCVDFMFLLK